MGGMIHPNFKCLNLLLDKLTHSSLQFIRHLEIPYCSLYDEGYTSLGGTLDTHPNPVLLKKPLSPTESPAESPKPQFRPAYELTEDDEERLGRD
jgi:FAD synthetase